MKKKLNTFVFRSLPIFVLVLLYFPTSQADWTNEGQVDVGFTDNALSSSTDRKSDSFYRLGAKTQSDLSNHDLSLRLNYWDYTKENTNDSLGWGLKDKFDCLGSQNQCVFQLRGLEYLYEEPQSTDSSFSNYALGAAIENSRALSSELTLDLQGGYELKNYHRLKRLDNSLNSRVGVGYELSSRTYLETSGELGLVVSSDKDFTQYYFELAFYSEYKLTKKWEISAELSIRQSIFLNRDLTTQTAVTRKNGRTVSLTDTNKESYTNTNILAAVRRILSRTQSLAMSLSNSSQKSRSGYQDYKINELIAQWIIHF